MVPDWTVMIGIQKNTVEWDSFERDSIGSNMIRWNRIGETGVDGTGWDETECVKMLGTGFNGAELGQNGWDRIWWGGIGRGLMKQE
jgi:hypothetical protein